MKQINSYELVTL